MAWLSEKYWCAGWLNGLEYEVWEAIQNPECEPKFSSLLREERAALRWLSELSGGWVEWSAERGAPVFVAEADWRNLVTDRAASGK